MIYELGGIYIDTDFFCHAPIDQLLDGILAFSAEQDDEFVNNAIFGAAKHHPAIDRAIESLEHVATNSGHCEEIATGPFLFTVLFRDSGQMNIFDRSKFYPMSHRGEYAKDDFDSIATHLWAFTWKDGIK